MSVDGVTATPDRPPREGHMVMRGLGLITGSAGFLASMTLLFMTCIVVYEVVMRSLFNMPTSWVAEISVYSFVALVFLGLGVAQRAGAHIQVEILIDSVSEPRKHALQMIGNWLLLILVAFCGWEMFCFTVSEYINDTRDWGLLATPQWMPETPVVVGYALFFFAILQTLFELSPRQSEGRTWGVPIVVVATVVALALIGRRDVFPVDGLPLDAATLVILAASLVMAWLWSGARIALAVAAIVAVMSLLYAGAQGGSLVWIGTLLTLSLVFLLLLGVPVGAALGMVGLIGLVFLLRSPQLPILADRSWTSINSFTLTAVPTFVLMGSLLVHSGITTKLFDLLVCWFGRTRGGLGHAAVGSSAIFAAVSGSSLATAATLGRVAAPELARRGYSDRLTYGVVAAGSTLGILLPPSIAMIIYGNTVGAPITVLFIAGIIPGLMLAGLFAFTILGWSYVVPSAVPQGERYSMAEKLRSLGGMVPFLVLIFSVLGSLYFGIATPTEAGAVGAAAAFVICVFTGRAAPKDIYLVLLDTVKVTAFIMLIVIGASIFGWVFDFLRLPREMVAAVTEANLAPWLIMLLLALFYLAMGTLIESISMMLMTLSVTYPIVVALGFDPIWFGVVLVILVEIGLITPPVGIVLFILRGLGNVSLRDVALGVTPFIIVMLAFIVLLYAVPEIVLWLPEQMENL
ncbi:TRAP transporter large permease subunit [Pseudoroseicyclus sp. CXY001]|uniref:TRAP transporter large permease n=1 Tax=Pseudoroseicyclus sp. CXY001 TaxID=3242492 RepID=UPI00358DA709